MNIDIDDYLEEASNECLFAECLKRYKELKKDQKVLSQRKYSEFEDMIFEVLEDNNENEGWPRMKTLADLEKRQAIKDNWNQLTLDKLQ